MLEINVVTPLIQAFLASIPLEYLGSDAADIARCPRAGVIVYHKDSRGELHFNLVLPRQKPSKTTPPDFQIAKGGRSILKLNNDGTQEYADVRKLKDLDKGTPLNPNIDALREAMEEQGLRLDNIAALYEVGLVEFISVSKGTKEPMWCVAARLKDAESFDIPSDPKTDRCAWFSLKSLKSRLGKGGADSSVNVEGQSVRCDHIKILIDFAARLMRHESH